MNCGIIFYSAKKTSFCEKALKKSFSELELSSFPAAFATGRVMLGEQLEKSFKNSDVVFIIGGLDFGDDRSITEIIAAALRDTKVDDCKRLDGKGNADGFMVRSARQLLVLLPDEPQAIERVMQGCIKDYIKALPSIA